MFWSNVTGKPLLVKDGQTCNTNNVVYHVLSTKGKFKHWLSYNFFRAHKSDIKTKKRLVDQNIFMKNKLVERHCLNFLLGPNLKRCLL